jgi:hypothetical protein
VSRGSEQAPIRRVAWPAENPEDSQCSGDRVWSDVQTLRPRFVRLEMLLPPLNKRQPNACWTNLSASHTRGMVDARHTYSISECAKLLGVARGWLRFGERLDLCLGKTHPRRPQGVGEEGCYDGK